MPGLSLLLLGAFISCEDSTAISPIEVMGTYVLVQVDSSTLPTVLFDGQISGRVLADTFRLRADFRGTRSMVLDWENVAQHTSTGPQRGLTDYSYHIAGDRIELQFVCPINALCSAVLEPRISASLTADGLRITSGYRRLPLVYARVSRAP